MKKNTLQKAVATALVGAMAVSTLAGCNKSANSDSTTAGNNNTETTTPASSNTETTQHKRPGHISMRILTKLAVASETLHA